MSAEQSLRDGDLGRARAELQEQVRKEPANPRLRVFLFQLYAVLGEWERALTQLQTLRDMDPSSLPLVTMYGDAVRGEAFRAEVFAGRRSPVVLGEPEPWVASLMEALRLVADGHPREAKKLRERAFEEAPAVPGGIDGHPFEWAADADTRLGPVLEIVVNGRYLWVPLPRIREMQLEKPADLRDLVWIPARLALANGGEAYGLVPTRYAGTEAAEDDELRLARKTEWRDLGGECFAGLGQRLIATDAGEYPLLDLRALRFAPAEGQTSS